MSYTEFGVSCEQPLSAGICAVDEGNESERGFVHGPLRALMSALLFDGVIACLNYAGSDDKTGRIRFREAFNWVTSLGDEYVFSFENVCQCLGLDPGSLRGGLIKICSLRREGMKKTRRTF